MEEKPPIKKSPMEVKKAKLPDDPKSIRARIYQEHYERYFSKRDGDDAEVNKSTW